MQFQAWLRGTEVGLIHPNSFQNSFKFQRTLQLQVGVKNLSNVPAGSVTSMQLDPVQQQYLISTGQLRTIYIHDTWHHSSKLQIPLIATVDKKRSYQHTKAINKVQWYPHDTGVFVTSSFDGSIKIWDTNQMKPVETLRLNHPICDHHLSSSSHSLIAATTSIQIRLADIRTGSTSHVLKGHQGNVLCVKWSPRNEYVLSSGSQDNRINFWDVRHAKAMLHSLDQHNGLEGIGEAKRGVTAHNGHVNSLMYTKDGMYLLSFGTDERLRLWNTDTNKNTLINYGRIANTSHHQPLYMDVMDAGHSSSVIFVPSDRHVHFINLFTGVKVRTLNDHFNTVRCCVFNPNTQELYTSAQSSRVLIASPYGASQSNNDTSKHSSSDITSLRQDTWSDSD